MEKALKEYQAIIFDLDGTLVDSFSFFLGVLNRLSIKYKFKSVGLDEVEHYRHLSPREIMKEMNVSRWKLPWIAKDFIRLMKERDQDIHLFEGMRDQLVQLHNRGYTSAEKLKTIQPKVVLKDLVTMKEFF